MIVPVTNMFENAQWQKPIFQELISRFLLQIETSARVFFIALGPMSICIAIRTIGLLYFIIQGDILNPEIVQRLGKLSKSVGSFCIRCGLGWILGGLAGTIISWAVPEKTAKSTRRKVTFVYQIHKLSVWPLLYFVIMADV